MNMFRKTISMLVATSMIALLAASLTGCGGGSGGSGTGSSGGGTAAAAAGYYVDPNTGSDSSGDGSPSNPYKTLTHAIQMASAVAAASSVNIYAASGAYNIPSGESFPVEPTSGENLIGQGAATISGGGAGNIAGGDFNGSSAYAYAVFFSSGVTSASVSNFTISGTPNPVGFDHATATLTNNTLVGTGSSVDLMVMDGANATLTNNNIQNGYTGIQVVDPTTGIIARGNNISQNIASVAIYLGATTPITATAMDLGTASSPGNNTIIGSVIGEGLYEATTASGTIQAVGNTWQPNIQGADPNGHYASQLIPTGTSFTPGNNYDTTSAAIQF